MLPNHELVGVLPYEWFPAPVAATEYYTKTKSPGGYLQK